MDWKKNGFSYFAWLAYTLMAGCALFISAVCLVDRIFEKPAWIGIPVCAAFLALAALLVYLLHTICCVLPRPRGGKLIGIAVEGILLVAFVAAAVVIRSFSTDLAAEEATYYENAMVVSGQTIPQIAHGAVYLYLQLLHLTCMVFGNKMIACVWLQIVLQLAGGLFLYGAVRILSGSIAALSVFAFIGLSPYMLRESLTLSPRSLYLFLFSFVLFLLACLIRNRRRKALAFLSVGLLVGVIVYLDLQGSLLFLAAIAVLFGEDCEEKREEIRPVRVRLLNYLAVLFGGFLGLFGSLFADSCMSAKAYSNVLKAWWSIYTPKGFSLPATLQLPGKEAEIWLLIAGSFLVVLGVFSFWCRRKTERQSIWVFLVIALALGQCFQMTTASLAGFDLLYLFLVALTGTGIGDIFTREVLEQEDAQLAGSNDLPDEEPEEKKLPATQAEKTQESAEENLQETASEEIPKVTYLSNPLPLPRKHVRKKLEFDYEVPDDAEFDLTVSDEDDFDI